MANSKPSICFDCQNGYAHKCKWVAFKIPVKGWKAVKRKYKETVGTGFTYQVMSCPNFKGESFFEKAREKAEVNQKIISLAQSTSWTVREIARACGVSVYKVDETIKGIKRYSKCNGCGKPLPINHGKRRKWCNECMEKTNLGKTRDKKLKK